MTTFLDQLKQQLAKATLNDFPLRHVLNSKLYGSGLIVDLGTGQGQKANLMAGLIKDRKVHTFDCFTGNPTRWRNGFESGAHNMNGQVPGNLASNVVVYKGLFKDTLPAFVASHRGETAALISVDCDEYASTNTALTLLAPLIKAGTILVFDELLNYDGYQDHEVKAFEQFLAKTGLSYQVIGTRGNPYHFEITGQEDWRQQKAAFKLVTASQSSVPAQVVPVQAAPTQVVPVQLASLNKEQTGSSSTLSRRANSPVVSRDGIKVKLFVPYGRRKVFENLLAYLLRELDQFDQILLWKNTTCPMDLTYLKDALSRINNSKFVTVCPPKGKATGDRKGVFAAYEAMNKLDSDPNTLWIKIDDDVVWVEDGSFKRFIDFAINNRYKFSVFSANIVNSGPLDALHQKVGASDESPMVFDIKKPYKTLFNYYGARQVHESLQKAIKNGKTDDYHLDHSYLNGERFSINCIGYWGSLFTAEDFKRLAKDDEKYICKQLGKAKQLWPVVVPDALMAHYSFGPQLKTTKSKRPGEKGKKVKHVLGFDPSQAILNGYKSFALPVMQAWVDANRKN